MSLVELAGLQYLARKNERGGWRKRNQIWIWGLGKISLVWSGQGSSQKYTIIHTAGFTTRWVGRIGSLKQEGRIGAVSGKERDRWMDGDG